jgi:5'-nucleotidase/UDP-sugar diphosphatase
MKRPGWLFVAFVFVILAALLGGCATPPGGLVATPRDTAVATAALPSASTDRSETIVLLHTNDLHGAVEPNEDGEGGLVNLVSLIDQVRAEDPDHTLLLDAGDSFQGTYVSNSTQGEVVMAAMNLAGYNAWALGNHEFDWGQEVLHSRIAQAGFPVLAANVRDAATGELWDAVEPYTIVQAGQTRVAVLGLAYPDTPTINEPQNVAGLEFQGAVETVRRYLPELEKQANLIVVLSHLGYDGDRLLASSVEGIDVIVGGHSHLFLNRPEKVNGTIIVQAGAKGEVLGRLDLTVDLATGTVTGIADGKVLLPVSGDVANVNQEVKTLVDAALADAEETMNEPIGETARPLDPRREGEFALGNLVVDAMLAADVDGRPADIAFHNNAGLRASLPKGPITFGQLYAVLPFDDELMAMDLSGAQVLEILEQSVAGRAGALQVAGLTFRFDPSKPGGQRVSEVTVGDQPLDPAAIYRVVTIDYLAAGGDGYDTFLDGENVAYGDPEVWVVAEYIREHSPVNPRVEGRIVRQ